MVTSCWLFLNDLCYDAQIHEHQVHCINTFTARYVDIVLAE